MELTSSEIAIVLTCPTCCREFRAPRDAKRVVCTECGAHTLLDLAYVVGRLARWAGSHGSDRP